MKSPETTAFEHIRRELETHLDHSGAPEEIRPFLLDHWARLMTGIFMAKGNRHPDWQAGWDTINALLWSLTPKQGREETFKLLRILPTLLARLHEGCAAMGYDLRARDQLFATLAMLHAAIAREGLHLKEDEALPGIDTLMRQHDTPREKAEITAELEALRPTDLGPDTPAPNGVDLPELKVGDWVRFTLPEGARRLRLTWVSPQHGMFLFANGQGLHALSLTRARLRAKFEHGEARLEAARR